MTITAKFDSSCKNCGGFIQAGEQVDWTKGVKGVTHAGSCPAAPAPKPGPKPRITSGNDFETAKTWLLAQANPSEFDQSLIGQLPKGLTERQIAACLRQVDREAAKAKTTAPTQDRSIDPGLDVGVYETTDGIFMVRPTKDKKRLYAKRMVEINAQRATEAGERVQIEFVYDAGAIYKLTPADKMDLEKAKELTIRYGRCMVCGIKLQAAESVERGIGPVCIKTFGARVTA